MNVRVLMLGKNKGDYIEKGVADFVKKLRPYCQLELVYIKDEKVHADVDKVLKKESERILPLIRPGDFFVVLDEKGKSMGSEAAAAYFSKLKDEGQGNLTFLIGSAHGLSTTVKESADLLLSLSPMTMNHQIIRLVLLEQIYRIFSIQRGTSYHK